MEKTAPAPPEVVVNDDWDSLISGSYAQRYKQAKAEGDESLRLFVKNDRDAAKGLNEAYQRSHDGQSHPLLGKLLIGEVEEPPGDLLSEWGKKLDEDYQRISKDSPDAQPVQIAYELGNRLLDEHLDQLSNRLKDKLVSLPGDRIRQMEPARIEHSDEAALLFTALKNKPQLDWFVGGRRLAGEDVARLTDSYRVAIYNVLVPHFIQSSEPDFEEISRSFRERIKEQNFLSEEEFKFIAEKSPYLKEDKIREAIVKSALFVGMMISIEDQIGGGDLPSKALEALMGEADHSQVSEALMTELEKPEVEKTDAERWAEIVKSQGMGFIEGTFDPKAKFEDKPIGFKEGFKYPIGMEIGSFGDSELVNLRPYIPAFNLAHVLNADWASTLTPEERQKSDYFVVSPIDDKNYGSLSQRLSEKLNLKDYSSASYLTWVAQKGNWLTGDLPNRPLEFVFLLPNDQMEKLTEAVKSTPDLLEEIFQRLYPDFTKVGNVERRRTDALRIIDLDQDFHRLVPDEQRVVSNRFDELKFSHKIGEV